MTLNKLKQVGKFISGMLLLAGLVYGTWWMLHAVWSVLFSLDKSVLAALITGTLVASGAIWVKYIEHRHSVEAQFRDAKVKLFNDFMEFLDQMATKVITTEEGTNMLKEWKRKTLFWGGPKVMAGFLSLSKQRSDSKTVGEMARHVQVLGDLILAMRKDVGLSNRGIVTGSTKGVSKGTILGARYMMRYPDLFLDCLQKDPSTPIERLTALEAREDATRGLSS